MFNAKVLIGKELIHLAEGVPQGNILSPLLSNVYFAKLDERVEHIINKYKKGERPTRNLKYYKAIQLTEEEKSGRDVQQINELKKKKTMIARKLGLTPSLLDDKYCRINYVRYADDFIVGVRGTKEVAKAIFKEIESFLKSELHLKINADKSHITNIYVDKAHFLGMTINCTPTSQIPFRRSAHVERFRRLQLRVKKKIEEADKRYKRKLQEEMMKNLRRATRELGTKSWSNTLGELCERLGISLAIRDTNDRSIYRKLAGELSQLRENQEDPELRSMLDQLRG